MEDQTPPIGEVTQAYYKGTQVQGWYVINVVFNNEPEHEAPCFTYPVNGGYAHFELRKADEDKTYIEALMSAPARPEQDYTAQEAAAKRMEEWQATWQQTSEHMNKLFTQISNAIIRAGQVMSDAIRAWLNSPQVRRFLATMRRILNRINPPKYRARQRPISTRRMQVYQKRAKPAL